MKKLFLAALAVTAIFATACSKEDGNSNIDGDKRIMVRLPGNTVAETRMVDTPATPASQTTIANGIVFLLANGGVSEYLVLTTEDIIAGYVHFEQVAANVDEVIVVANYPAANEAALEAATTKTAITGFAFTAADQATTGITGKTLIGSSTNFTQDNSANPGLPTDTHDYYKVDVALDAITARFEIGTIAKGTGVKNVKMEGVWMNQVPHTWGANPTTYPSNDGSWVITPSANTAGSASAIVPTNIPAYDPSVYHNAYDASVDGTNYVYAFQIFAGDYVPHVIMLVSGRYDDPANGDPYFLGWLTFNYFTDNDNSNARITKVENNMIYKLSGFVCNAQDFTYNPELGAKDLGVKCTITDWTEKNLTPGIE